MRLYLIIIALVFLNFQTVAGKNIRILIFSSQKNISFEGKFVIQAASKKIKGIENTSIDITLKNNKLMVNGIHYKNELYFKNIFNGLFKIGNCRYRGDLKIILKDHLYFINYINIEEYTKGVLPNEISSSWPIEVLKAQAVAARTFAYYFVMKNMNEIFDLSDTTYSQVYKGIINENINFNSAIKETAGQILSFGGGLVQAFFYSACGGHTESAEKVWGKNLPYLRGVPCNYCVGSKYYTWEAGFTEKEIINKLKAKNHHFEGIRYIRPARMSSSGRWVSVKIIGRKKTKTMSGNNFRLMFGAEKLRSTKFNIRKYGNKFIVKGKGWGHGVGMCQWGAKKMAEKGYKYYKILRYYYRGTTLKNIKSIK